VHDYETQVTAREAHTGSGFTYRLNLQTIAPPFSPLDELRQMLREKITPDGRAIILLTPLVQSIHGFADTATRRNAWISDVQAMPEGNDAKKAAWFFGRPYAPGLTDDRYPKFINALKNQTDDSIAFSILMARSLVSYGEALRKRYGSSAPKIYQVNFDTAAEFLPDMSHYAKWPQN
jgi:hypothetical protein